MAGNVFFRKGCQISVRKFRSSHLSISCLPLAFVKNLMLSAVYQTRLSRSDLQRQRKGPTSWIATMRTFILIHMETCSATHLQALYLLEIQRARYQKLIGLERQPSLAILKT